MKKCHERTNKLFSVVIPNYKRTHELKRAIDSVLRQDGYDDLIENIFIVDDKSENIDEIEVIINDYNRKEIILIKNDFKSNAAYTRNQGARYAISEWICFLDSDDTFTPTKVKELSEFIKNDMDVIYNKAFVYFDDTLDDIVPHRALNSHEDISDYLFFSKEYMQTSTLTVRRSFFNAYGFIENYKRHQDYDLCLTFQQTGMRIAFLDIPCTNIIWGGSERPIMKGESFEYSLNWLNENRGRITDLAYDSFYWSFIVIKAARSANKIQSIKYFLGMNKKNIRFKDLLIYLTILSIPSILQHKIYLAYKRLNTYERKNKSGITS